MPKDIFYENISRRFVDIAIQANHASQKGVSTLAKSGYYRFAILLACTIVEALLFVLVKNDLKKSGGQMGKAVSYKHPCKIPDMYVKEKVVLCIREESPISLTNQTKFSELIKYASSKNLVNEREKIKLEKIMRFRNKIHLQSLESKDNGYTKQKLDEIFSAIGPLVEIYKNGS